MNKAFVEGSVIDVCDRCVKFGRKIIQPTYYKPIARKIEFKEPETELISDYGKMITKLRESKGLTREKFAKRISEKESVIRRIEEERMIPDEELAKRIESFLGIKLTQEYKEVRKHREEKRKSRLTVGDIVEIE